MDFSVAMSVYSGDKTKWLKEAVGSILNQTAAPSEIVLVVDGKISQELNNLICGYEQNPLFKIIRFDENQGLGKAMNKAIENCSYEIVARMDSDDISVPTRFEQQISFLEKNPEVDVLGGNISEFVGEISNVVGKRCVPESDAEIKKYMKKRCAFNHMSVMFKKSSVINSGNYIDWFWNEDYYLWIRMMHNGCVFANTGTELIYARINEDMYRRRGGWRYFKSEIKLQTYMLKKHITDFPLFITNCIKRIVVQLLLPNRLRGWVFRRFARSH